MRAATERFTTQGWTKTGMREIATAAGVAVETLYSHFSSKRMLFDAVVDEAVMGDSEPLPVAQRPEFLAMGRGRRRQRFDAAASLVTAIQGRTAPFAKLIREASTTEGEIAEVLRGSRERQRQDVAAGLALMLDRSPTDDERDGVWALLSAEVYTLLVDESGWSSERYEKWLSETLARMLPR
jgi:AcrR family transcriptional regulator